LFVAATCVKYAKQVCRLSQVDGEVRIENGGYEDATAFMRFKTRVFNLFRIRQFT
jgi:hypothetical protein